MERTIKFRGKDTFKSEFFPAKWWYGGIMQDEKDTWMCVKTEEKGIISVKVIPNTVGQFTGLTDKNGKEIYEGDIILCKGKYLYQVEWISDGFMMRGKTYGGVTSIQSFLPIQREVIGNIHDNPEMLKR